MPPHTASVTPLRTIIIKAVTAADWETEMPDGYFLKRRCRLWGIAPDSQQLTKYAAHLACFKPGQMCIIPTQHPDIQQLSHRHCTSTSKTFRHNLPPRAVSTTAAFHAIHCHCGRKGGFTDTALSWNGRDAGVEELAVDAAAAGDGSEVLRYVRASANRIMNCIIDTYRST